MMPPRLRFGLAGAAAIAAVTVLSIVSAGSDTRPTGDGRPATVAAPARAQPATKTGDTSLVPATGAYLGAYVGPTLFTTQGQIDAVRLFERDVKGSLEIVHVYHPWREAFPTAEDKFFVGHGKILLISWGGDPDTPAIIAGKDDAMIRARAKAVRSLGHPIMLEFRHEMDRPNLRWTVHGAGDYIKAWDHIRAIFKQVGATNVSWVWCPTAVGFADGRAQRFYPGDNEVDWIGADAYSPSPTESLRSAAAPFLRWASHHDKPVMIGEFAVGGDPSAWPAWITAAGRLPEIDHQVKAMVYFDADGTNYSGNPYRYQLDSEPALKAFAGLLRQPAFDAHAPNDP